jgi:peptidoglycan glycosyltransferase
VKSVDSATGSNVKTVQPQVFGEVMTTEETQALEPLLEAVVQRGTAADDLSDLPYQIAGKTGTAEYGDISEEKAHSWFTGYTNTGNNDIVVCAVVEDGGNGRAPATQVARSVFSAWGTGTY